MRELDPQSFDRTDFLPLHEGPEVLPHDLIFYNLHHLAVAQNEVVVRDTNANHVASHRQFLSDIVACRNALRQTLDLDTLEALQQEREVCILILSHGYEFVVAFFATLAIGAIAVPLSMDWPILFLSVREHFRQEELVLL
jgi:acyl-CoA synthetase (AMP-forming)/AMP-acid ligase II